MDKKFEKNNKLLPPSFCKILSKSLANNHLYCSLTKDESDSLTIPHQENILKAKIFDPSYNRRVIAITGAGVSYEADLLLAQPAAKKLRENIGIPEKLIDMEIEKIRRSWGLRPNDFETTLLACSTTALGAKLTRKKLLKMFGFRYRPLRSYEILAHLFKHRFLDAIVNFNFDELLDQSIADELRPGEYDYVLSDGDLNPSTVCKESPLKRPIYIKPHGTVSHPSTLRFTHEDYFNIPDAISDLLHKLLTKKDLDLVVFGFSMDSPEIEEIISRCKHNVRIFIIDKHVWEIPEELESKITECYQIQPLEHYSGIADKSHSSLLIEELWTNIENTFRKSYRPRKITRHQLLADIFNFVPKQSQNKKEQLKAEIDYLWNRTVIEVCLAIARGRGFISLPYLMTDRAGNYYREYLKKRKEESTNIRSIPKTLIEICELLGMQKAPFSDVIMVYSNPRNDSLLIPKKDRMRFAKNIHAALKNKKLKMSPWLNKRIRGNSKKEDSFKQALLGLYDDGDVEIRLDIPEIFDAQFNQYTYLGTPTAIKYRTLQILGDEQYPFIRVVSEIGEWIVSDQEFRQLLKKKKQIEIILADDTNEVEIKKIFGAKVQIKLMKWWEHNRHMTLAFMSEPNESTENCKGIFWNRRLRTPDLRPVFVSGKNSYHAQAAFDLYWNHHQ